MPGYTQASSAERRAQGKGCRAACIGCTHSRIIIAAVLIVSETDVLLRGLCFAGLDRDAVLGETACVGKKDKYNHRGGGGRVEHLATGLPGLRSGHYTSQDDVCPRVCRFQ